jgi:ureidoacrylate peracid hydrolase
MILLDQSLLTRQRTNCGHLSKGKNRVKLDVRYYSRYPFENPRGLVETVEEFGLDNTAFVLVDVYGKGFDEGDPIPDFPPLFLQKTHGLQSKIVREGIRPALDAARSINLPIVYVENRWHESAWAHSQFAQLVDRTESGHFGPFNTLNVENNPIEYSKVMAPTSSDYIVEKTMYDGFFRTTLDTLLRNLGVKNLIFVGFTADICLLNTVIGALNHNYRVVVLRDGTLGAEYEDSVDDMSVTKWTTRYYEAMVGFTSTSGQFVAAARSSLEEKSTEP